MNPDDLLELQAWMRELQMAALAGDQDQVQIALKQINSLNRQANYRDEQEAGKVGGLATGLMETGQAVSSGLMDEAAGSAAAIGALLPGGKSPGEAYTSTHDVVRDAVAAGREQHPGIVLGSNLVGGLLPGAAATKGVSALARMVGRQGMTAGGRGLATGALMGAARGVGEGKTLGERAMMGAVGGGVGGALGGGIGVLMSKLGRMFPADAARMGGPTVPGYRTIGESIERERPQLPPITARPPELGMTIEELAELMRLNVGQPSMPGYQARPPITSVPSSYIGPRPISLGPGYEPYKPPVPGLQRGMPAPERAGEVPETGMMGTPPTSPAMSALASAGRGAPTPAQLAVQAESQVMPVPPQGMGRAPAAYDLPPTGANPFANTPAEEAAQAAQTAKRAGRGQTQEVARAVYALAKAAGKSDAEATKLARRAAGMAGGEAHGL